MLKQLMASKLFFIFSSLVLLLHLISPVSTARILLIAPFESQSQCILMTPYIEALAERGHELTVIHAYRQCGAQENVRYIYINPHLNSYPDWVGEYFSGVYNKWIEVTSIRTFMLKLCLHFMEDDSVKDLLNSNSKFDLVIIEPSHMDCIFGIAAHFNATLMGLSTCGSDWNLDTLIGYTSSSIYEPILPIGFRSADTFLDRLYNWFYLSEEWLLMHLLFLPKIRMVHYHFFGHLHQSFTEIRQSFSLMLLNQHFTIYPARPNVPTMIEIAGMHLPKKNPSLPVDLADFIDSAPQGVIYFAMGVEMQSKDLPEDTLQMLLNVFEALPQRVIWKFERHPPPSVSKNIYIDGWLPQMAILAHPNVKLFITNAGMLSIIETIYYAKPVIGLPLFYDQFRNLQRILENGVGKMLNLNTMTTEEVKNSIHEIIQEPQYQRNALALSQRFRDQPMHPLDTAVYWTEYILRYKGAPHMRVSLSNMKFIDYYCLDKLLLIAFRFCFIMGIMYFVLMKTKCLLKRLTQIYTLIWFTVTHYFGR
ncbi:UDP-glycosyltransferase UGT5 [Drosophila tropicalis]|uniref:UDP-glycosyltransferase UGT5 n=1 Tax=Drosophila tropicalis TaxID=46794 RepID=UPI0035AB7928